MKNIRHNTIRNTAIAIVALAGLAVASTACSSNSSTDSASKALDATIDTVADQPESSAEIESPDATSSVTADVESPAPSSAAPASPETAPSTEAPATTTPATTTPATTTPTTPSTPGIVLLPTIHFVTFGKDGLNISSSILVEEGGAGRNDIVSVEMSYTKFGVTRTVAATQASSTTTSSLWLIDGLMLRAGDTVTIHAVDARGNADDMTTTVTLTTSMG